MAINKDNRHIKLYDYRNRYRELADNTYADSDVRHTVTTIGQPTTSSTTSFAPIPTSGSITLSGSGTLLDGFPLIGNTNAMSLLIFANAFGQQYTKDQFTLDPVTGYVYVDGNTQAALGTCYGSRGANGVFQSFMNTVRVWSLDQLSADGFAPLICLVDSSNVMHCHINAVAVGQTWTGLQVTGTANFLSIGSGTASIPIPAVLNWNPGKSFLSTTPDVTACASAVTAQPAGICGCKYTQNCNQMASSRSATSSNIANYSLCMTACDNDASCLAFAFDSRTPTARVGDTLYYKCSLYYSQAINPLGGSGVGAGVGYLVQGSCQNCSKGNSGSIER